MEALQNEQEVEKPNAKSLGKLVEKQNKKEENELTAEEEADKQRLQHYDRSR